jgi:hypothetical protein
MGKVPVGPVAAAVFALILYLLVSMDGCHKEEYVPLPEIVPDTVAVEALMNPALTPELQSQLDEANQAFTFARAPISPFAVRELMEQASERRPGPVAIDLAGAQTSNRYRVQVSVDPQTGSVTAFNPPDLSDLEAADDDMGYFTYWRLGQLTNGWHVLRVSDNDGGPGVFEALLLVRVRIDTEYSPVARPRLLLERRGVIQLGDRYDGRVQVFGDSISVTADLVSGYQLSDKTYGFTGVE